MNHTTLLIFKLVAETQSVTQAAKQLGRAQSNITTRIQQLEEELEAELFVRGNKKMLLSPAGQNFLSYARRILSLAEEAKLALHPARPRERKARRDGSLCRQPPAGHIAAVSATLPGRRPDIAYHAHPSAD